MNVTRFNPENFMLDPQAEGYELDQDVAARIADVLCLYDIDGQKKRNYFNLGVVVDPTGQSLTSPNQFTNDLRELDTNRISFSAALTPDVNQTFSRHMQAILLERERRSSQGLYAYLSRTILSMGLTAGFMVQVAESNVTPTTGKEMVLSGTAALFGSIFWMGDGKQYYRRYMVNPGSILNKRKLAVAESMAKDLLLPPVVFKP